MSRQIGAKRQKYDTSLLDHAADLVRANTISLCSASREYGIPKTTLQNAVQRKYSAHKVGHKTVLTEQEEQRIANWAIHMSRIGYGRTRRELVTTVKKILDADGRPNPFKDNTPGKDWLKGFFKRNPDLSLRTTIQLGKERAVISAEKIAKWFFDFKTYIEDEVKDLDLLKDPSRIYNADESGFSLCVKGNQVIGYKGAPVIYHYGNSDKTQLTIMAAVSASAHYIPPMIIFPGQRFGYNPLDGFPEAALGHSDNGWIDSEVFCQWLQQVFIPSVNARNVKKPVLLLIDGHSTHVTMSASDICLQNGIELYCLLEHSSHVLQPLDLRLFSSLKKTWRQAVRDWQSEHIGEFVTKRTFAGVFKKAWEQSTTVDIAVKGFQEAGLFPFDPLVVVKSVKIEPSKLFLQSKEACETALTEKGDNKRTNKEDSQEEEHTVADPQIERNGEEEELMEDSIQIEKAIDASAETGQPIEELTKTDITVETKTDRFEPTDNKNELAVDKNASPFSKHLTVPSAIQPKNPKARRVLLPKAITGSAYRQLMEDKKAQKEQEEQEKENRKAIRLQKRAEREQEKQRKQRERQRKAEEKQRKKELKEQLLKSLEDQSDTDDAIPVGCNKCYACERPYEDLIQCSNCMRRFHFECATDEWVDFIDDMPFECKYC